MFEMTVVVVSNRGEKSSLRFFITVGERKLIKHFGGMLRINYQQGELKFVEGLLRQQPR